jgi:hypothetical protein
VVGGLDRDNHSGTIRIPALINLVGIGVETDKNRTAVGAVRIRVPVMVRADAHG